MNMDRIRSLPFQSTILMGLVLALVLLLTSGCDTSPSSPEAEGPAIQAIILQGDDGSFSYSHADHWHGSPTVDLGSTLGFTVHFSEIRSAADDHDPPPTESWFTLAAHPDLRFEVIIENPTLAQWSGSRDRGTLIGQIAGASRLSIVVKRGNTTIYEAPPLNFRVRVPVN